MEEIRTKFTISAYNYNEFTGEIDRLNKRAKRLGLEPVVVTKIDTEIREQPKRDANGNVALDPFTGKPVMVAVEYHTVIVTGQRPVVAGWQFIATLEAAADEEVTGMIISAVPGAPELPREFRTTDTKRCDHCRKAIFRRKAYVIQEVATERFAQVGGTCLTDFVPGVSVEQMAAMAEIMGRAAAAGSEAEDEDWGRMGGPEFLINLADYMAWVAGAIRVHGWKSRSEARNSYGIATADVALENMEEKRDNKRTYHVEAVDTELATNAISWIRGTYGEKDSSELSDYEWNVALAFRGNWISEKQMGIAASGINLYARKLQSIAEAAARDAQYVDAQDAHYGQPGEKFKALKVKLIDLRLTHSDWGSVTIYKMITEDGFVLTWFCSGDAGQAPEVGQWGTLRGSVKAHGEYNGRKQTVLTRCKFTA